jgi:hypothetical protein
MSSADLVDAQVIRDFRSKLAKCVTLATSALDGSDGDLRRVLDWMQGEQLPYWKRQLRDREELFQHARRTWLEAENEVRGGLNSRGPHKASSTEERVLMQKAQRRRDEAEEKLASVRSLLIRIEQDCSPLLAQCRDHDLALRELGDRALAKLARLAGDIDTYHSGSR